MRYAIMHIRAEESARPKPTKTVIALCGVKTKRDNSRSMESARRGYPVTCEPCKIEYNDLITGGVSVGVVGLDEESLEVFL